AIAPGLLVLEGGSPPHLQGPLLGSNGTGPTTLRTRLFRPQEPALLVGGRFEGPGSQATGGGHGHLLHLVQIDIQPRSFLAEGTPHDDFSPALGKFGDASQILRGQLPCTHGQVILDVREIREGEFPAAYPTRLPLRRKVRLALRRDRPVRTSFSRRTEQSMLGETDQCGEISGREAAALPGVEQQETLLGSEGSLGGRLASWPGD